MVSFTTLLAFSAAYAGALAKPVVQERQIAIPEGWTWHVSGWEAGMTRSGSYYRFNVTVPRVESETTNIAGVTAFCEGRENGWYRKGNWYENCRIIYGSNNGVAAKLSERESDVDGYPREILISFEYGAYGDRPAYNFTGKAPMIYNAAVAPAQEFDVKPTEVFGIA